MPQERWDTVRSQILSLALSSLRSSKPAIYGVVAAAEVERLRPQASTNNAAALELAAAELAQAAAEVVTLEREIQELAKKGADSSVIGLKEQAR